MINPASRFDGYSACVPKLNKMAIEYVHLWVRTRDQGELLLRPARNRGKGWTVSVEGLDKVCRLAIAADRRDVLWKPASMTAYSYPGSRGKSLEFASWSNSPIQALAKSTSLRREMQTVATDGGASRSGGSRNIKVVWPAVCEGFECAVGVTRE